MHPHARHLERTLDWLLVLDPDASEAVRIAAATHDIERAYPDGAAGWDSARDWDSPDYNRWHQDRCADMVADGLRERGASDELAREVVRARARARGRRLARGRPRAGRRLALVPGDDGAAGRRLGRGGPGAARAGDRQAAVQRRPHQRRPAAGARAGRGAAGAGAVARARRQRARRGGPAERPDPHRPHAPPGVRALPADAAVARPSRVRGASPTARRRASAPPATSRGVRRTTPASAS